jgi:hypothetical protein
MTQWIAQLGLLADADDFREWTNILFIGVIMLVSVVSGLIKNAGTRRQQQQTGRGTAPRQPATGQPRETWQQRLARKAEEVQRAFEAKYEETHKPQRVLSDIEPKVSQGGRLAVRTDRSGESVMVFEKDRPASIARQRAARERHARDAMAAAKRVEAQRRLTERQQPESSIASMTPRSREPALVGTMTEAAHEPAGSLVVTPPLIDYDDPGVLAKAILHYEILGKPLALRDPFDRTSAY